jgi:hypothetical protein
VLIDNIWLISEDTFLVQPTNPWKNVGKIRKLLVFFQKANPSGNAKFVRMIK